MMKNQSMKHTHIFQFRLDADLFEALVQEVERRKSNGEKTSINQVGQEWMEKGKNLNENDQHIRTNRPSKS
jgi:hypothetical protein